MFPAGEKVCLRALEPDDLEFLYRWENNPEVWKYGDCGADVVDESSGRRFSREALLKFIDNQQYDINITEQLRFVICLCDPAHTPVGFIDLFDFDPVGLRAGVGILICDPAHRGNGYGREALELISDYALEILGLCGLWCNIAADNKASLALFYGAGFVRTNTGNDSDCQGEIFLQKKLLTCVKSRHLFPSPIRQMPI